MILLFLYCGLMSVVGNSAQSNSGKFTLVGSMKAAIWSERGAG